MRKFEFTFAEGWNDYTKEVFEYEEDVTQEEVDADFETWIWNIIGDRCCVEEID